MRDPKPLKRPRTLSLAVRQVIEDNRSMGLIPHRFIQKTQAGNAPNLKQAVAELITNPQTQERLLEDAVRYPQMLTIEDFVIRWGSEFGFTTDVITQAEAMSKTLDLLAKSPRYKTDIG